MGRSPQVLAMPLVFLATLMTATRSLAQPPTIEQPKEAGVFRVNPVTGAPLAALFARRRGRPRGPLMPKRPFWYLRRGPDAVKSEVDEELNAHLEMRVEELRRGGLPADAARREALSQFGDLEATRQYCRLQDQQKEKGMRRGLIF